MAARGFGTGLNARVAYMLELDSVWGWASFNTLSTDLGRLGVPANVLGYGFQQNAVDMNVRMSGGTVADGVSTGTLEFTGTSYGRDNALNVPGASDAAFDNGDTFLGTGSHGCLQVFYGTLPVLCYNGWNDTDYSVGVGASL
jgi:hypothetical protein